MCYTVLYYVCVCMCEGGGDGTDGARGAEGGQRVRVLYCTALCVCVNV